MTDYRMNVTIESAAVSAKIHVIKAIRACVGVGLKHAKDLAEKYGEEYHYDNGKELGGTGWRVRLSLRINEDQLVQTLLEEKVIMPDPHHRVLISSVYKIEEEEDIQDVRPTPTNDWDF